MKSKIITVNSRKFDGEIYRSWKCELLSKTKDEINLVGKFEKDIRHNILGFIRRDTISYELFRFDSWFNVFRFHEPDGKFRNFYCNISLPPTFESGILDYIDLDIDVLVHQDFSFQILDVNEFEQNAEKFSYSTELCETVQKTLSELITKIENRIYPFDYKF